MTYFPDSSHPLRIITAVIPDFPGNPVLCHSTGSDHRWIPDAHISNQD